MGGPPTHLPQEPPLAVVEQADDGRDDDRALRVLGHVLEHGRQAQQHDHDQDPCATHQPSAHTQGCLPAGVLCPSLRSFLVTAYCPNSRKVTYVVSVSVWAAAAL